MIAEVKFMDLYDDTAAAKRYEANQLFHEAYEAQLAHDNERAIELYKRSIETYPPAEAHTFLGWVYSFQKQKDDANDECLEAIRLDETLCNPYNDICSYQQTKNEPKNTKHRNKQALFA